ncbi:MAG: hypothetical protein A2W08_05335 [Candidatus Rokubacteria bacterium RBG_16_73_20]|nr:MAG: hypothetical protein A2050_01485 [Candidatus Rokubacteria bacterium GWA2_73_35]OGK96112.1 MAG: hypothetical protein A2W08_05335 [Candidatus Rokubacteria bacterium RBG_16_73_20]HBH03804.1 hypothetical protein [Candidatus Rokubacteria bacterium]
MTRPSPRALLVGAGAVLALGLLAMGGWFWRDAAQRQAQAAYAAAMTGAQPGRGAQATPEARAAAIQGLEAVLGRYPSAPGAAEAAYELGNLRYAAGAWAGARGAWEIALVKATASPTLRRLAQASIGYAWEAERKYGSAAEAYRAALAALGPQDFLYEQLLLNLARVQEVVGQKAEAVQTYRRVLAEVSQTRRGPEIRARLLALGAS